MWIASCTKLMTSICSLQLVERGFISLDEPVYSHIPELKDFPLITGFNDDGSPNTKPHKNPITLRKLLTHTSGISYEELHPSLIAWNAFYKLEPSREPTLLKKYGKPLVFEPGTSWAYGPSTDYVGLLVERISGQRLEDYMRKNLWEPLGIKDMTFVLDKRPDLRARLIEMTERDATTGALNLFKDPLPWSALDGGEVTDDLGGNGVFASPGEYIRILHALLTSDEDGKILKKETVELLNTPQLNDEAKTALNELLEMEMIRNAMGGPPREMVKDWGLVGLLFTDNEEGGRKKGTLVWGGLPCLVWFCDRKTGLTGLFAAQLLPTGDTHLSALTRKFESDIYELFEKHRKASASL